MRECETCQRCLPDEAAACPEDGGAAVPTLPGAPSIDRYRLERRLGQGGMGVVYRASHEFLHTAHALKIILPGPLALDPKLAKRFRQEAMAVAAVRHPNVVAITDYGIAGGTTPFLVMELLEGRPLEDLLAVGGRLAPARALEILAEAGAGVAAAHARGIVHRDLKPLNIFILDGAPPGRAVKVLDFGLAKVLDGGLLGSLSMEESSGIVGTAPYLAPEQWLCEEPDGRTDVYALGVILYQMLAGRLPFVAATPVEMMRLHLEAEPPRLGSLGAAVPPRLEQAVRHALAKERALRPPSVTAFLDELDAARVNEWDVPGRDAHAAIPHDVMLAPTLPQEFGPPGAAQPLAAADAATEKITPEPWHEGRRRGWLQRLAKWVAAAGLLAGLFTFSSMLSNSYFKTDEGETGGAEQAGTVSGIGRNPLHTFDGHTESVDAVAFVRRGGTLITGSFDATVRVWAVSTSELMWTHPRPVDARVLFALVTIPNTQLVALATDRDVRIITFTYGEERRRLTGHKDTVLALAASPDGKLVAGGGKDGTVIVWDVMTGEPQFTHQFRARVRALAFSPDSGTLACAGYESSVTLLDSRTGELNSQLSVRHAVPVLALAFSPDGERLASADAKGHILLRDASQNAASREMSFQHGGSVNALAFSPYGHTLASGGDDMKVVLWDVTSGREHTTFTRHTAEVNALAFSPDGKLLATGSRDRTAMLWKVPDAPAPR